MKLASLKKYTRVAVILGAFLVAAMVHHLKDSQSQSIASVVDPQSDRNVLIIPSPTPTRQATPTPSLPTIVAATTIAAQPTATASAAQATATSTAGSSHVAAGEPASSPTSPTPTPRPSWTPTPTATLTGYRDGTYTGVVADAYYGPLQVQAIISGGRITDVKWLQWPTHARTSQRINSQVMPWLTQEAVQAQSANVNIISGASASSFGFRDSLYSALQKAMG